MPTPPTAIPSLYIGSPPGSPDKPKGSDGLLISEQGSDENCTPYSGPPERKSIPGGKCSWMMKPAVRVVKAFPVVLKREPVPALEIAASAAGTTVPSRPRPAVPTLLIVVVAGAPVITKTPSTFASRSVTATVTARFRDTAADTAWLMMVCTSLVVRLPAVAVGAGGDGVTGEPGVGTAPSSSGGPPPTWPIPTRTRLLEVPLYVTRINTSPKSSMPSLSRMTSEVAQGWSGTPPTYSTGN